jgi:hypothetical protein
VIVLVIVIGVVDTVDNRVFSHVRAYFRLGTVGGWKPVRRWRTVEIE